MFKNYNLGVAYGKELIAEIKTKKQEISEIRQSENEKRKMIRENTQEIISEIEKQKNERIKQIEADHQLRMDKLEELKIAIEKKDEEEISRIMNQLY